MPYIDLREHGQEGLAMVATVHQHFEGFTHKEIEKAIQARVIHRRVGHLSDQHFESIMSEKMNQISNVSLLLLTFVALIFCLENTF